MARQAKRTEPHSSWRPFKPKEIVKLLRDALKAGDEEVDRRTNQVNRGNWPNVWLVAGLQRILQQLHHVGRLER